MMWYPFRRAFHNPIFRGTLEVFSRDSTRWSHGLNYLIILSIILFITWPKEAFLRLRDLPFTYNALSGAAMIMLAYIALSQGSRQILGTAFVSLHDWLTLAPVPAGVFLRGYLAGGLLETTFYWGLSLPLLAIAASVSGESLGHLLAGASVMLISLGCYRTVAVALLMCLVRDEFVLYLLVRVLFVFFILGSGFVWPVFNPILAFVDASIWHSPKYLPTVDVLGLSTPGWTATIGLHLLLGWAFFIIASVRVRRIQQRSLQDVVEGG